ncbi:MAG: ribonuclease Y [Kiritimatiellia bacterium]
MNSGVIAGIAGTAGVVAGYVIRFFVGRYGSMSAEKMTREKVRQAERDAETIRKEAKIQAKAEVLRAREEFESATASRKKELAALEERISTREVNLDRKVSVLDRKEAALDEKSAEIERHNLELGEERKKLKQLIEDEFNRLQKIAGMSREEARRRLLLRTEKEMQNETGALIRRMQDEALDTAEKKAQEIVANAVQRCTISHAGELMTSTVALPDDDMKGRIIGREGRNIRALEAATGVNVLIDDTPEAVVISGFDPVRREIARLSLENLVADGRIHPARIEEVVSKYIEEMEETIRSSGEAAAYEVGVQDVHPELVHMLGRLKFRTSYSQNVLKHSLEVAHLIGVMAGELGLDAATGKRVGLFHDIGKALDHTVEGGHAAIGADFLKKHGEDQVVVNAAAAHHEEVGAESVYAVLASAADAISGSRVGARSETTEIYLKRLEALENLAGSFEGVSKSYAIQAGREVRVIVEPENVDDNGAMVLARDISRKMQEELQYPGQIKVVVLRETRCVEYAR